MDLSNYRKIIMNLMPIFNMNNNKIMIVMIKVRDNIKISSNFNAVYIKIKKTKVQWTV